VYFIQHEHTADLTLNYLDHVSRHFSSRLSYFSQVFFYSSPVLSTLLWYALNLLHPTRSKRSVIPCGLRGPVLS